MADFFARNTTAPLQEHDLSNPARSCVVCSSTDLCRTVRLRDRPAVWLLHCRECGISTADRIPTSAFLDRFYADYYAGTALSGEKNVTVGSVRNLARHILRSIKAPALGTTARILDFGGGDGSVSLELAKLLSRGSACPIEIVVVDICNAPAPLPPPPLRVTYRTALGTQDESRYDIVIASASLEHIREPGAMLTHLLNALGPRGTLYARTPFHLPMARLFSQVGLRFDLGYPSHLHDMGAPFWDRILATLEMEDSHALIRSAPSVVASTFNSRPARTLAAHAFKAPWYLLGNRYGLVGGWEVAIGRSHG